MSPSAGISRRNFVRGGAATGAALLVGPTSRPAQAFVPLAPVGVAVGAMALTYAAGEVKDYYTGQSRDLSGYVGGDALLTEAYADCISQEFENNKSLTLLSNNIEYVDNALISKGKVAATKEMNADKSQTAQESAALAAIDAHVTQVQKNLLEHWNHMSVQSFDILGYLDDNENVADPEGDVLRVWYDGGEKSQYWDNTSHSDFDETVGNSRATRDVELSDGSTYATEFIEEWHSSNEGELKFPEDDETLIGNGLGMFDEDEGELLVFENGPFQELWDELAAARDRVWANVQTMITDVNNAFEPGDIPDDILLDAGDIYQEMITDYDETGYFGYAAAHAAMLGIPTSASYDLMIELKEEDVTVAAHLYAEEGPDGPESAFEVGTVYDPSELNSDVFIAFEMVDEDGSTTTGFTALEENWEIVSAYDQDGEELDEVTLTSRNHQTYDVAELEVELLKLQQHRLDLQAQSQTGGGGEFDLSDLSTEGIVAVVLALILAVAALK